MNKLLKVTSLALAASIALMSSCKDEDRLNAQDAQDISEESMADSYFQDMDDMAGEAIGSVSENEYSGGRVASTITIEDDRFKCQGIVVTITPGPNSTTDLPQGVLTVDFGVGCTDLRGNVRTGKLIFTYNGRRFQPESTIVTTTENYTINGVKIEGIRTLTNITGSTDVSPKFNAVLENGKATFPDLSEATRESDITWQWVRSQTPSENYLLIDQASTASGTTRGGRAYEVSLLKSLKYKRFCGIAVEGIKKYVLDGEKEITIDYGDGTCDKSVVITVNGVTRNISIN